MRSPDALELDEQTAACLANPSERARFDDYGRYIHLTAHAPHEDDEGELHALECVSAGRFWQASWA
jgi:hypothetical protein